MVSGAGWGQQISISFVLLFFNLLCQSLIKADTKSVAHFEKPHFNVRDAVMMFNVPIWECGRHHEAHDQVYVY